MLKGTFLRISTPQPTSTMALHRLFNGASEGLLQSLELETPISTFVSEDSNAADWVIVEQDALVTFQNEKTKGFITLGSTDELTTTGSLSEATQFILDTIEEDNSTRQVRIRLKDSDICWQPENGEEGGNIVLRASRDDESEKEVKHPVAEQLWFITK